MKMMNRFLAGAVLVTVALMYSNQNLRAADGDLVPLTLKLPAEAFKGTPKDIKTNSYTEPYPDKPRPPGRRPVSRPGS